MPEKTIDPVCGMEIEKARAVAKIDHQGKTYFFCAPGCKVQFERNPEKFARPEANKE